MIDLLIYVGLGALAVSLAVVIWWSKILTLGMKNLLPWVEQHVPSLAPGVRQAFRSVDKVAPPVKLVITDSWRQVRRLLLQQTAEYEERADSTWLLRITSWVQKEPTALEPAPPVTAIRTEQDVIYEELPEDVRAEYIRKGHGPYRVNVTRERDHELGLGLSA